MKIKLKLEALRSRMKEHGIDAYLVPTTDAHQSEYVPECWERRPWISGFTGSAGDVLVTATEAGLWTDGRYFLQAAAELKGSGIKLYKTGQAGVPSIEEFLQKKLGSGGVLGVDPKTLSYRRSKSLENDLSKSGGAMKVLEENLVDQVWSDRPALPAAPVSVLPTRFSGEATASKLRRVRKEMKAKGADAHVVTTLDSIAWLFNIRGRDVDFNPVTIAYALVTATEAVLFVSDGKISAAAAKKIGKVTIRRYEEFGIALDELRESAATVWVDESSASRWVLDKLATTKTVTDLSPIVLMKAKKNETEIQGMRDCHVRDGAAVARFLCWLETAVPRGGVTEISAADKLEELRSEGEHFQGLSFRTISGYREHGAIIHYTVTPKTDIPLERDGIYLLDSGAQYLDGTTDITRTVLLGRRPSKEQKDRFTRVLKGNLALSMVKFPEGVTGPRLDTLARSALWDVELDYNHGTGHGVGSFLNVHEGPRSIGPNKDNGISIEPGNVFSNEPGYYKDGEYGIRIENLVVTTENGGVGESGKAYYKFETLTLCPIDTRLVDPNLLTKAELTWLNAYHRRVHQALAPFMDKEERVWLKKACSSM